MTMIDSARVKCEKEIVRRSGGKTLDIDSQEKDTADSQNPFTFSSQPRALYTNQTVAGSRGTQQTYSNLMYERRIFRGSNYAQSIQTSENETAHARTVEARRRALARRKAQKKQIRGHNLRLSTPPPVAGRKHEPVQTDSYLEEIWCNPPVVDVYIQTDLFCEKPVSPFYVPPDNGVDTQTQIYPGELFDFDLEVQPVLEELVNKTIEQSLVEVLEEDELSSIQVQNLQFLEDINVNIEKIIAEQVPDIVKTLKNTTCSSFQNLEVNDNLTSWLTKEVSREVQQMMCRDAVLSDVIEKVLRSYLDQHL